MAKIDDVFPLIDTGGYAISKMAAKEQRDLTLRQEIERIKGHRGPITNAPGPLWVVGFSAALTMLQDELESLLQAPDAEEQC